MEHQHHINLQATVQAVPAAISLVDRFVECEGIPEQIAGELRVAVDELVTNVVMYVGKTDAATDDVKLEVSCWLEGRNVRILIKDSGPAFNPLKSVAPDLDLDVVDRPIGGLGIHLVRKTMDRFEYVYESGYNIITLTRDMRRDSFEKEKPMALKSENIDGVLHVELDGRIDATNAEQIQTDLMEVAGNSTGDVCLQFGKVDYISSMGLRVLLMLAKKLRQNGFTLSVKDLRPSVLQVLQMSGFDTFLKMD